MDLSELYQTYNTTDFSEQLPLIAKEYKLLIPELSKNQIWTFVCRNSETLRYSTETFKMIENGPFEKYIKSYYKVNQNLNVFLENEYGLRCLRLMLEKGDLTKEQLKDTCDENERVLLIYNQNFWEKLKDSAKYENYIEIGDFSWMIKTEKWLQGGYNDFLERENCCVNERINKALSITLDKLLGEPNNSDKQKFNYHIIMSYIMFFTDYVEQLYSKRITVDEFVDKISNGIESFNLLKSNGMMDLDTIERNLSLLNEQDERTEDRLGF